MDVQLYVYDLSKGLARVWSRPLTGIQIDAIYHTSLVLGHTEYFFGNGVKRKIAGTTHHGQPIEVLYMGHTELPMEVIDEYVDSLEQVYTEESYDLFLHNCNNFTQDLSMFLLGKVFVSCFLCNCTDKLSRPLGFRHSPRNIPFISFQTPAFRRMLTRT